ncbi:hypothetical protein CsSME_00028943 [Camellia sinensis var. sinensis]|uniref:protein CWC15 homolog isoform X2 n=1 Tax=Camellia sinensis TaxID=4442 RepID=UPI0010356261|nr:protein CWC15 homolog isoform X2 [Camellia sinensis]
MTTVALPTWAPAKGGNEQGGTRIFSPSQKYSSSDIASHTTLKPRKDGQDTKEELQKRNLRDELEEQERWHFLLKDMSYSDDRDRRKGGHLLLEGARRDAEDRLIPRSVDADDADVELKSNDGSDDDDDEDDEDDTEALLLELEQIKKELAIF